MIEIVAPDWDVPAGVHACCTARNGGASLEPFDSLNLALHVGDTGHCVRRNRALLRAHLKLPQEPCWMTQVHGTRVVTLERDAERRADAAVTREPGRIAVIMTADCLPVLICNRAGTEVAAIHAGWRGLQAGVIEAALDAMKSSAEQLVAWIGPGISQPYFEVGDEVRVAFSERIAGADDYFIAHGDRHWHCDLAGLATCVLKRAGVIRVARDPHCSFRDSGRFYSYRREQTTGRMASLIWFE